MVVGKHSLHFANGVDEPVAKSVAKKGIKKRIEHGIEVGQAKGYVPDVRASVQSRDLNAGQPDNVLLLGSCSRQKVER